MLQYCYDIMFNKWCVEKINGLSFFLFFLSPNRTIISKAIPISDGWNKCVYIHLIFSCGELLSIGKIVHGNGEEDVEEGVVPEQGQHDEVQRVDHPRPRGHKVSVHCVRIVSLFFAVISDKKQYVRCIFISTLIQHIVEFWLDFLKMNMCTRYLGKLTL